VGAADGPALTVQHAIEDAFAKTARRWEHLVGVARVLVCLIMLVRTILIWNEWPDPRRVQLAAPMVAEAGLYIAASLVLLRSRAPIKRLLMLSVALDTMYIFTAFLPNVLWPWQGYLGIVNTPDMAALFLVTLLAGLRLSPGVAVFGGILNILCFAALLLLDLHISDLPSRDMRGYQYMLQGTFLVSAVVLSIVIAVRTQRLVDDAVRTALKAEGAQRSFDAILHEHHDIRTLLSAARVNADRLATGAQAPTEHLVDDLRSDLGEVEALLNSVRARAYGELLTLGPTHAVEVCGIARDVLDRLHRRFPTTALVLRGEASVTAQVAGSEATLQRALLNIVINACQGDGERGAAHVNVEVRSDDPQGRVTIDVIDDGPGFSAETLAARLGEIRSTKVGGSGFGLGVALALAQASDGTLTRVNRSGGGAMVSLSLPLARSAGAPECDVPQPPYRITARGSSRRRPRKPRRSGRGLQTRWRTRCW
jgi:signal transduction histidine kinase